ncbi:hypothetical protein AB4Z32_25925 [Massilia sp. 2TAF26]|uniref:hypothetical protein n=1 Tax=Massilia sp. 2TAF26 TaxID=3233012 RepID=UPI003F975276
MWQLVMLGFSASGLLAMTRNRILFAYCEELKESVNIDTARRHFLSEDPRPECYHFFCDDPHCGSQKVRISGVNYRTAANESPKYVTAHYRNWDEHSPDCMWESDLDEAGRLRGETEAETKQRKLRLKLKDLVTDFDPSLDEGDGLVRPHVQGPAGDDGPEVGDGNGRNRNGQGQPGLLGGRTKTNQLSRLVETYREAKVTLSPEEFSQLELRVTNEGVMPLHQYFCRISRANYDTTNRVIFGGATFAEWYGAGFKLKFYDRVDKKFVFLYVSPAKMEAYRFRKYFKEILSDTTVAYFTVFALGRLEASPKGNSVNLIVDDLRHLDIVRGKTKEAGANEVST